MDITAQWHRPHDLTAVDHGYTLDLGLVPAEACVYVFGRHWGENACPLYIGRSLNLRQRLKEHFDSIRFMRALQDFPNGQRFLMWCSFNLHGAQDIDKVLDVVERGLIDRALTEGHELVNIQGTRTPKHIVSFQGNRTSEQISGREIFVRKT